MPSMVQRVASGLVWIGWSSVAVALQASAPIEEVTGPDGLPVGDPCIAASLSRDGRFLGFSCTSGSVAAREAIPYEPFVMDRTTRAIRRVQFDTQGVAYSSGGSGSLVADDGSAAVFATQARLHPDVPPPTPGTPAAPQNPYLRRFTPGATEALGRDAFGAAVRTSYVQLQGAAIAQHLVLFGARADLRDAAQPVTASAQLYVRDWQSGALDLVTETPAGAASALGGFAGTLSRDGRYVAFLSYATDLGADNATGTEQLFLHDRVSQSTRRLSRPANGGEFAMPYRQESAVRMTADARTLALASDSDELVAGDAPGRLDIFLVDAATGRYALVTRAHDGGPANEASFSPAISADGRYVAFFSRATNLLPQPQSRPDVYVLDRFAGELVNVSASLPPATVPFVANVTLSGDGSTLVFNWRTPTGDPLRPWRFALYTVTLRGGPLSPPVAVPATPPRAGLAVLFAAAALFALRRRFSRRASASATR